MNLTLPSRDCIHALILFTGDRNYRTQTDKDPAYHVLDTYCLLVQFLAELAAQELQNSLTHSPTPSLTNSLIHSHLTNLYETLKDKLIQQPLQIKFRNGIHQPRQLRNSQGTKTTYRI